MSRVTLVQFLMNAEILCSALAILRGTEPVSALTRALLILLRLYDFFVLGFCQWRSHADKVVILTRPS